MELHLHLSAAFRALDRKWGPTVDLETSEVSLPCVPAVIDPPSTTFSSEEFLKKRYRPKPYSRVEIRRRKENVKRHDSFADISSSKIPSLLEVNATSMDSGIDEDQSVTQYVKMRSEKLEGGWGSEASLDSGVEENKPRKTILKRLRTCAESLIDKKWQKTSRQDRC